MSNVAKPQNLLLIALVASLLLIAMAMTATPTAIPATFPYTDIDVQVTVMPPQNSSPTATPQTNPCDKAWAEAFALFANAIPGLVNPPNGFYIPKGNPDGEGLVSLLKVCKGRGINVDETDGPSGKLWKITR